MGYAGHIEATNNPSSPLPLDRAEYSGKNEMFVEEYDPTLDRGLYCVSR